MSHIPEYRSASDSQTTIIELMVPSDANFGGKIHGGHILSLIDKVAYACASKYAGTYCVTISVDTVNFFEPIEVGELVSFHATVNYVGRTSLNVGIKVVAENFREGVVRHTNTCYVTMVAIGADGKPQQVPELMLETESDVRRFLKAIKRREQRNKTQNEYKQMKADIEVQDQLHLLDKERCIIHKDMEFIDDDDE